VAKRRVHADDLGIGLRADGVGDEDEAVAPIGERIEDDLEAVLLARDEVLPDVVDDQTRRFPIVARDPCRACKACDLRCMPPLYARCNGLLGDATLFLLSDSSVNSHSDSLFALPLQEKLEFLKSV